MYRVTQFTHIPTHRNILFTSRVTWRVACISPTFIFRGIQLTHTCKGTPIHICKLTCRVTQFSHRHRGTHSSYIFTYIQRNTQFTQIYIETHNSHIHTYMHTHTHTHTHAMEYRAELPNTHTKSSLTHTQRNIEFIYRHTLVYTHIHRTARCSQTDAYTNNISPTKFPCLKVPE